MDRIAAPEGLAIRPVRLVFSDLYLVEEFKDLDHGLRRLRRAAPTHVLLRIREDRWLKDREGRTLSYQNLGWLDLSRLPKRIRPAYIDSVAVAAVHVTPSTRMLSFEAHLTPAFEDHFRRLAATDGSERIELTWIRRHGLLPGRMTPAWIDRKAAYDELFLAANREMTSVLRKYVGVGRVMEGPLQAIEVLAIDAPVGMLPVAWPDGEDADDDSRFSLSAFFDTLGRRSSSVGREYRLPWGSLYPVARDSTYDINSYQLIVSTSSYAETEPANRVTNETVSERMLHSLFYLFPRLAAMLVLQNFYRQLRRATLAARDEIAPLVGSAASIGQIRRGQRKMAKANALFFRETRVWTEFNNRFAREFLTEVSEAFVRPAIEVTKVPGGNLAEDFWPSIEQDHLFCRQQLELLRSAFSEVLAYATLVANDRLQRIVLWLSLIATVAALLALPETLWNWLGRVFEM